VISKEQGEQKPMTPNKTVTGRGDLIRFLAEYGNACLDFMAEFAGEYERKEIKTDEEPPKKHVERVLDSIPEQARELRFSTPEEPLPFWYVARRKVLSDIEKTNQLKPVWAVRGRDLSELARDACEECNDQGPGHLPLVSWSRIWPFLRHVLGTDRQSREPDVDRIIERITAFEPLKRIPFKPRTGWESSGCLILDFDDRLLPIWGDINGLHLGIEHLRGKAGLAVYMVETGPEGQFKKRDRELDPPVPFVFPEPGTPVLIVSDLGYLDTAGGLKRQWLRFGERLRKAGLKPVVLTPCPPSLWDNDLFQCYAPVWWDRGARSFRVRPGVSTDSPSDGERTMLFEKKTFRLLSLLSPAIRVEPELLRAVRMALPVREADVSTEITSWNHPSVSPSYVAFSYGTDRLGTFREAFLNEPPEIREQVMKLIDRIHCRLPRAIRFEERLNYHEIEGTLPDNWTEEFICAFFRTFGNPKDMVSETNRAQWFQRVSARISSDAWGKIDALSAVWLIIHKDEWKKGTIEPPDGNQIHKVLWVLPGDEETATYEIRQEGTNLHVDETGLHDSRTGPLKSGSHVAYVSSRKQVLTVSGGVTGHSIETISLRKDEPINVPLSSYGPLSLATDMDEIILTTVRKPSWAASMGRDSEGLFIRLTEDKDSPRIPWPEWGGHVDYDNHGLFAEFTINGVTQRMRWIGPGMFMMGSPESEPERMKEWEHQHPVTLTKGYWLGETACTQELWEAVMGNNPSGFKGKSRPVETVSWDDCMEFIRRLNGLHPGLDLRLPTEAEWEYACRAGTKTPFSFGKNITPDQVNYNGNYPYKGGKKGKFREETVDVKLLPVNPWGLYEMHGNVWEWCSDWYGDYPDGEVIDPKGPDSGGNRVMRGGSWDYYGRIVRSAGRSGFEPGDRVDNIGFRLARGQ
jgi:formylglycine-generating enzyme required for sulfatase activity